jgi:hypothetical protein
MQHQNPTGKGSRVPNCRPHPKTKTCTRHWANTNCNRVRRCKGTSAARHNHEVGECSPTSKTTTSKDGREALKDRDGQIESGGEIRVEEKTENREGDQAVDYPNDSERPVHLNCATDSPRFFPDPRVGVLV